MTFENILTEDKRLNSEWVDLSTAKLQLEGRESTLETMQIEALRIRNLPISCCPVLALAFQGESWNNQAALIHGRGKKRKKKKKRRLQMWCGITAVGFHTIAAVTSTFSPRSPPALTTGGLLAGAILVQLDRRSCDGISAPALFFFFVPSCPRKISVVPS